MKSFNYYDLMETFEHPRGGCAICTRLKLEADRYLTTILYEYSTDGGTHQLFRAARGLCNHHAWQMSRTRKGMVNLAVLYEGALDEVLTLVNQAVSATPRQMAGNMLGRIFGSSDAETLAEKLVPDQQCPCCEIVSASEVRYIEAAAEGLKDSRFMDAFQKSHGFCVPHLIMILRIMKDPTVAASVIQHQRAIWSKLKEELLIYINLYGLNGEGQVIGEEATSWLRAIANLAGGEGVFADNLNRFET